MIYFIVILLMLMGGMILISNAVRSTDMKNTAIYFVTGIVLTVYSLKQVMNALRGEKK